MKILHSLFLIAYLIQHFPIDSYAVRPAKFNAGARPPVTVFIQRVKRRNFIVAYCEGIRPLVSTSTISTIEVTPETTDVGVTDAADDDSGGQTRFKQCKAICLPSCSCENLNDVVFDADGDFKATRSWGNWNMMCGVLKDKGKTPRLTDVKFTNTEEFSKSNVSEFVCCYNCVNFVKSDSDLTYQCIFGMDLVRVTDFAKNDTANFDITSRRGECPLLDADTYDAKINKINKCGSNLRLGRIKDEGAACPVMQSWTKSNTSVHVPDYDVASSPECVFTRENSLQQPPPDSEDATFGCWTMTTPVPTTTTTLRVITLKQCPAFCDPSCSCADDTQVLLDAEGEFDAQTLSGTFNLRCGMLKNVTTPTMLRFTQIKEFARSNVSEYVCCYNCVNYLKQGSTTPLQCIVGMDAVRLKDFQTNDTSDFEITSRKGDCGQLESGTYNTKVNKISKLSPTLKLGTHGNESAADAILSTWNRCNLSIAVPTYDTSQSSCVFTRLEQAAPSPCQEPVNYNCPMTTTSIPTTTLQVITLKQCPAFCDPSCSCADDTQVLLDAEGEFDAQSLWGTFNLRCGVLRNVTTPAMLRFTQIQEFARSNVSEYVCCYNCINYLKQGSTTPLQCIAGMDAVRLRDFQTNDTGNFEITSRKGDCGQLDSGTYNTKVNKISKLSPTLKLGTHGNESAADAILSTWNRCNLSIAVPTYDTSQSSCVFTRLEQAAPSPCQEPINYDCPTTLLPPTTANPTTVVGPMTITTGSTITAAAGPVTTAAAGPVTTAAAGPVTTAAAGPVTTAAAGPITTKAAVTTAAAGPITTKAAGPVTTAAAGPTTTIKPPTTLAAPTTTLKPTTIAPKPTTLPPTTTTHVCYHTYDTDPTLINAQGWPKLSQGKLVGPFCSQKYLFPTQNTGTFEDALRICAINGMFLSAPEALMHRGCLVDAMNAAGKNWADYWTSGLALYPPLQNQWIWCRGKLMITPITGTDFIGGTINTPSFPNRVGLVIVPNKAAGTGKFRNVAVTYSSGIFCTRPL